MLKAYVGTTNGFSLTSFLPEDEVSRRLIAVYSRHCSRRQTVCFWAAVPDEVAKDIRTNMLAGKAQLAQQTLATGAADIAPLFAVAEFSEGRKPPPLD